MGRRSWCWRQCVQPRPQSGKGVCEIANHDGNLQMEGWWFGCPKRAKAQGGVEAQEVAEFPREGFIGPQCRVWASRCRVWEWRCGVRKAGRRDGARTEHAGRQTENKRK